MQPAHWSTCCSFTLSLLTPDAPLADDVVVNQLPDVAGAAQADQLRFAVKVIHMLNCEV
jgi:hypothetical protein